MTKKPAASKTSWSDPDDAPEITEEWIAEADIMEGDKVIRRGRPKSATTKELISLRLDPDVIEAFRATGAGWQSRINETLRRSVARRR